MKRVMVAFIVLLAAGLIVSASGAFSFPTSLSQLSLPSMGSSSLGQGTSTNGLSSLGGLTSSLGNYGTPASLSSLTSPSSSLSGLGTTASSLGNLGKTSNSLSGLSSPSSTLGSFSTPSSDLSMSTPAQSAFNNWNLNNMQFFSPNNHASTPKLTSIPASDYSSIMNSLSQLPSPDQAQQYYGGGTPTPTPAPSNNDTFITNVSSTIPSDQVIFIEASKNTMLLDPSNQGIAIPNVTMNYKYSDSGNKLVLKKKAGVDYNSSQLYFGYANTDDVNNIYVYDYNIGSSIGMSIQVLFHGSDGRIRISVDGVTKDLMPGTKYESISDQGNQRIVIDVTNWGLVPKANIQVSDTI